MSKVKVTKHIELMEKEGRKKLKGEQITIKKFMKLYKDALIHEGKIFHSVNTTLERNAVFQHNIDVLEKLMLNIIDEDRKGVNLI